MRRHVYLQAGGYWDPFFIGGEETLLAMDILNEGHHIVYAPALTVHHWPSHIRDDTLRRHLIMRNAIWTAWLRLPQRLAWWRTREIMKHISGRRRQGRVLLDALAGAHVILMNRRVLHPGTCNLFRQVWQQDA